MKESALVTKIIREVKKAYPRIYIRKISDRFTRGMPDILIVAMASDDFGFDYSITLFVECKTAKGKLSKLQELEIKSIHDNGSKAIVATDAETVLNILDDMKVM